MEGKAEACGKSTGLGTPKFVGKIEKIFRDLYPLYVFTSHAGPQWKKALRSLA